MNKLTKGSLATGAGLVLLLGGAGTFMSWNAEANVGGGTITTGHLKVTADAPPMWTVNGGTAMPTTTMESSYLAAPGDTIVYEVPVTIDAAGTNIQATVNAQAGAILGDEDVRTAFGASQVTAELEPTEASTPFFGTATDGVYTLEKGTGTATAKVTLTFDQGAGNTTMDKNITLEDLTVALTQVNATSTVS